MVNANERKTEEKIKIELIKAKYAKRNIRYIVKKITKNSANIASTSELVSGDYD